MIKFFLSVSAVRVVWWTNSFLLCHMDQVKLHRIEMSKEAQRGDSRVGRYPLAAAAHFLLILPRQN